MYQSIKRSWPLIIIYFVYSLVRHSSGYADHLYQGFYLKPALSILMPMFIGVIIRILMFIASASVENSSMGLSSSLKAAMRFYMSFLIIETVTSIPIGFARPVLSFLLNMDPDALPATLLLLSFSILSFMIYLTWATVITVEGTPLIPSFWRTIQAIAGFSSMRRVVIISAVINAILNHILDMAVTGRDFLPPALAAGFAVAYTLFFSLAVEFAVRKFEDAQKTDLSRRSEMPEKPVFTEEWISVSALHAAILSFIPPFNFLAIFLGWKSLRKKSPFPIKAYGAMVCGCSFTIVYLVMLFAFFAMPKSSGAFKNYDFISTMKSVPISAVTAVQNGNYQDAEQILESHMGESPSPEIRFVYAVTLFEQRQFEYCIDQLKELYTMEMSKPLGAAVSFLYGKALLETGNIDSAGQKFKNASALQSLSSKAKIYHDLTQNGLSPSRKTEIAWTIGLFVILLSFHEFAHAFASKNLGDSTAENDGRLTLDPTSHIDVIGSIVLPAILMLKGSFVIGWARPVPVNLRNLKNQERDHMRIAIAGPAMNFAMALLIFAGLLVFLLFLRIVFPEIMTMNLAAIDSELYIAGTAYARPIGIILLFFRQAMFTSLFLGCFNLIPLGPLDGSAALRGLLPTKWLAKFDSLNEYQGIFFLLLILTPAVSYMMIGPYLITNMAFSLALSAIGFQ